MTTRKLTPDQIEEIVELKLQRVPVRKIAEQVGTSPQTVQKRWKQYLRQRADERRDDLEAQMEEALARLEKNATDARRGFLRATREGEERDAAAYLAQERAALVEIAKLGPVRDSEPMQAARVAAAVEAELAKSAQTIAAQVEQVLEDMGMTEPVREQARRALAVRLRELEA